MEKIISLIERLRNNPRYANKEQLVQVYSNCIKYQVYGLDNCSELIKAIKEIGDTDDAKRIINFEFERTFTPSLWVAVER